MITRAAIYARQSEDVAEGIVRQLTRCRALAEARGYVIANEFTDNDTSAFKSRGESTAWASMLSVLRTGDADLVIAVDLDRLLRDPRDLATIIDTGARLLTVDGEIDLTTADGEFRASMLASLARFEVRRKSERQRRANESRRASGKPTPGRRRYGYETDGLTPRASEATHVGRMFDHVANGGSLRSLVLALTAEGVPAGTGGQRNLKDGRVPDAPKWTTGKVRYILTNPAYGGALPRRTENFPSDVVVAVVDPTLAAEVRAILADDARRTTPGPTPRYLASGLARCGAFDKDHEGHLLTDTAGEPITCGALIYNIARGYRCHRSTAHVWINRPSLDARLRTEVARAVLTSGRDLLGDRRETAIAPLMAALDLNDAAARATSADRDEGLLSAPAARDRLVDLRGKRIALEARIEAARVDKSASSSLADVARDLLGDRTEWTSAEFADLEAEVADRFASMDIDRQRETARALLDVTVYPGRDNIRRVSVWHLVAEHLNPDVHSDDDADYSPESTVKSTRPETDPAKRRLPRAVRPT